MNPRLLYSPNITTIRRNRNLRVHTSLIAKSCYQYDLILTLICNFNSMKMYTLLYYLLFTSLILMPSLLQAAPFNVGEKLEYSLSWGNIPAGNSVMEITELVDLNGQNAYHLLSTTLSNKFVSSFYKVNSRINSYVDISNISSLKIEITERTGSRKKHEKIYIDSKKNKIIYNKNGEETVHDAPKNIYDSVSSIYYLRTRSLNAGEKINIKIFSSGKIYNVTINVLKRETITVGSKTFNTIKIHSVIMNNDMSKKKGETFIWLNNDEYKTPVRIETKIKIGSIIATLKEASGQTKKPSVTTTSTAE